MAPLGFENKVAFVWRVADKLRGTFKQHEYGSVMLPLLVLRRTDAVLAPTKDRGAHQGRADPSRLNRTRPAEEDTFVIDFANTAEEIQAAFEPFYEQSFATPTDPNILYTLLHDLMTAGVLSPAEMEAAVETLLVGDASRQGEIYVNVGYAVGRFDQLDEDAQEEFRGRLDHFVRAYAFLAQVMPWTDPELERLYLYGRLLLTELPSADSDPMPQLSRSVQLTHLRLAVTHEGTISPDPVDEPGVALPGEGKGRQADPMLDKLSALISAMNEKFGADLGEADKVWVDQQWTVVKDDDELRTVAQHNDRAAYESVLEEKLAEMLLDRHEQNGTLVDIFFEKPGFKKMLITYLAGTFDEFRSEASA